VSFFECGWGHPIRVPSVEHRRRSELIRTPRGYTGG
jgi:hypothetical protein